MARKIDSKETVTLEELLMSTVIEQEALVNLLEKKELISKADLLKEITKVRDKQQR